MNNIPFLKAHHVRFVAKNWLPPQKGIDVVINKNILGRVNND